jgi:hypothetical protein
MASEMIADQPRLALKSERSTTAALKQQLLQASRFIL